jgi:hypothetical protein
VPVSLVCDRAAVRRPDLPLLIVVVAVGVALALFVDPESPVERPLGPRAPVPDALQDATAEFDPVFVDCFGRLQARDASDADPSDLEAVVDQVSARVERLRRLRFREAVDARFLGTEELEAELTELVEKELPVAEVRREGEILRELGAIPEDGDLEQITADAFTTQVAGLYDTRTGQLLVQTIDDEGDGAEGVGAAELITLAHELEHALADQALGIPDEVAPPEEADRVLAYTAVVEGDATLVMQRYALAYVGLAEQLSLGENVPGSDQFAALPDYVQRSLLFPYLEGLRLACHRWVRGGWGAVDELYRDPPEATDQVIFPARYGRSEPKAVELPPAPGPGWRQVARRELGAAELEWLFHAPGGDPAASLPTPRGAVAAWAGGELELWARGEDRAMAIALVQQPGTDVLCGAMGGWYRAGWPEAEAGAGAGVVKLEFTEPGRSAVLVCDGRDVRMGLAPDLATAARLAM